MIDKNKKRTALKVLFLEDTPMDAEIIRELISEAGYNLDMDITATKKEYESFLHTRNYDIILSDFALPGFDAFGSLRLRNEICPAVPFICVSGSIGEETAIELLKLGAIDYVLKDKPGRLPFAIQRALDDAKERDEHLKAEKLLRESELRFRQISESAHEWIWEVDNNGKYTYVSPVISELLGYEPEELVGIKYFYDFFDPEIREEAKEGALGVIARGEMLRNFINCNIHKDGRKIILSTTGFPILDADNKLTGYRGADVDITEQRKAEEKLKLSERNFNEAERIADTGSWEYDVASDMATWSKNMFRIFDVDPETPYALVFKYFVEHVVHPDDRTHILSVFSDAILGKGKYDIEYRIVTHDNSIRYVHALAETLRDQNNSAFKMVGWVQDITERKLAEKELHKREAYLSAIIENQPGLVWLKNTDGSFLAVNNVFAVSCGKHSSADVVGKTDKDIWAPELAEKYQSDDKLIMQSGNSIAVEELIIDKGEEKWFETFKTPVIDLDGKVIGTTGFAKDISERKLAEEMLRESELRFRSVWEKSTDGMRITNEEGIVVLVNDAYCKIVEKPREEIEGKPMSIVYEKAKQAEVLRKHKERFCSRSIPAHLERELVLWNGKKTFLELSNTFLENPNQPTLSLSVFKDITERKRAEKEIAMLAHSLKSINECVTITDLDDKIIFVNESFLKTYGYEENELIGKNIKILRSPDNSPELVKEILPATLQGGWKGELLNKRKDGSVFPISLSTTIINGKDGKPLGLIGVARDITERKKAEKILTESEERFRAVSEYSFNSICIINESGKIIWANKALCKMGGYSIEQIYAEESFIKFVAPISVEFVVSNFMKFVRDEEYEHHYEFYIIRSDGEQRLCEKYMTHFKNANGGRDLVISMMDITERRKAEKDVIKLSHVVQQSPTLIIITDTEGNIEYINPKVAEITGYHRDEVIGKNPRIFSSGQKSKSEYKNLWDTISSGKEWRGEFHNKKKNGEMYWESASISPIINNKGEITQYVAVKEDITQNKKYQEDILRMANVLENTPDLVGMADLQGNVFYLNRGGKRMMEMLGTEDITKLKISDFHSEEVFNMIMGEALPAAAKEGFWSSETKLLLSTGEEIPVLQVILSHKNSSNVITHYSTIIRDIRERKLMEINLKDAKEKAEESNRLKTEFLAQMSHEIRTPLNAIISFANILKDELERKLTPELIEYFDGINSAGYRLIRTVDMILNSSELQVGAYEPIFTEFGLIGEILTRIRNDYFVSMKEKRLEYNFSSNIKEAVIRGDKYTVYQLFVNLIDNAVKYTQKGCITVKVEQNEKFIEVSIEDTGIGISEEFMTKMYMPFFQEDRGYSRRYEGNGLGLSLVKRYCELNGISIEVESKKGVGTKFTLTFAHSKSFLQ